MQTQQLDAEPKAVQQTQQLDVAPKAAQTQQLGPAPKAWVALDPVPKA